MLAIAPLGACASDDEAPTASASLASLTGGTMTGTATFSEADGGVTISLSLTGCTDGKQYPVHIHQGASCADAAAQGGHWDMTRGEGIPNIACSGSAGAATHTRTASPAETAWSIGDGTASDVVGHVIVVHDADTPTMRIACGAIAP